MCQHLHHYSLPHFHSYKRHYRGQRSIQPSALQGLFRRLFSRVVPFDILGLPSESELSVTTHNDDLNVGARSYTKICCVSCAGNGCCASCACAMNLSTMDFSHWFFYHRQIYEVFVYRHVLAYSSTFISVSHDVGVRLVLA